MTLTDDSYINDDRVLDDFVGITFSMFKKSQVKRRLLTVMYNGQVEEANYWAAELICCGAFVEIWECILEFLGRHIHLGNPKLPVYISNRFRLFRDIMNDSAGCRTSDLDLRNSNRIRRVFAEIITVLSLSRKKNKVDYVKIDKQTDFDVTRLSNHMKAPNVSYGSSIIKEGDPKEIFIAINEMGYNLTKDVKNSQLACYWVEWILEYEKRCRKRKEQCISERREFAPQNDNSGLDIIFIVWDTIIKEIKNRSNNALILSISKALLELFNMRYSNGCKRRRRHLIYFAIALLCESFDHKLPIVSDDDMVKTVVSNISSVYKQVKHNYNSNLIKLEDNDTSNNSVADNSNSNISAGGPNQICQPKPQTKPRTQAEKTGKKGKKVPDAILQRLEAFNNAISYQN